MRFIYTVACMIVGAFFVRTYASSVCESGDTCSRECASGTEGEHCVPVVSVTDFLELFPKGQPWDASHSLLQKPFVLRDPKYLETSAAARSWLGVDLAQWAGRTWENNVYGLWMQSHLNYYNNYNVELFAVDVDRQTGDLYYKEKKPYETRSLYPDRTGFVPYHMRWFLEEIPKLKDAVAYFSEEAVARRRASAIWGKSFRYLMTRWYPPKDVRFPTISRWHL